MQLFFITGLFLALVLAWGLNWAFRGMVNSADSTTRRAGGVAKSLLLWLIVGGSPLLFGGPPPSVYTTLARFLPELPLALVGTVIIWFFVPAKKSAALVGFLVGGALAPIALWTLALILPKNEGTMGYVLYGVVLAVPNAIAGAVAGHWRAQAGAVSHQATPRPLPQ